MCSVSVDELKDRIESAIRSYWRTKAVWLENWSVGLSWLRLATDGLSGGYIIILFIIALTRDYVLGRDFVVWLFAWFVFDLVLMYLIKYLKRTIRRYNAHAQEADAIADLVIRCSIRCPTCGLQGYADDYGDPGCPDCRGWGRYILPLDWWCTRRDKPWRIPACNELRGIAKRATLAYHDQR